MKIKLLTLLLICFILTQSCEKPDPNGCHNAVIFYNYLSDAARNQTPYFTNPAFDTISFASDKGDTLIFVKTKTDSTWYKEEIRGNPACDWDKNYFQILHNTYTTIKGSGTFDLRHSKKNNSGNIDIIELHFNDFVFYTGDYAINDIKHPRFLGNIIKNQYTFNNSMYTYNNYKDSTSAISYLNQTFGTYYIEDKVKKMTWILVKL
jgi:hypothetical protein